MSALRTGDYFILILVVVLGLAIAYLRHETDRDNQNLVRLTEERHSLQKEIYSLNLQRQRGREAR